MMTMNIRDLIARAMACQRAGNAAEARTLCEAILANDADNPAANHLVGLLDAQEQKFESALKRFDSVLRQHPGFPDAWADKGRVLTELHRHHDALACYQQAVALAPQHLPALQNQACTLLVLGRPAEALAIFDRVVHLMPRLPAAYHNRAMALTELGRYAEAVASCDRALALHPDYAEALHCRGVALEYARRHDLALVPLKKAASINPGLEYLLGSLVYSQLYCHDFGTLEQNREQLIRRVRRGERVVTPLAFLAMSDSAEDQLTCAKIFAADKCRPEPPLWRGEVYRHDKIRLGYMCSDFREHPTAYLMAGLFGHHDRDRFETIAVSHGPDDKSAIRDRISRSFDRFIDIAPMNNVAAAALLRQNEIDILVDLNGLIEHNRIGILAYRPAPIQASYLAYPGTLGVDYIDYLIADRIVIPAEQSKFYSERIAYLPHCYQVNDSEREIAAVMPRRADHGLPADGFVFCCFNQSYKFTPAIFDIWMRLLARVPDSVLWLIASTPAAMANLRDDAERRGVAGERIVFAPRMALPEHLARHRLADLFLDTLPYNAHTTASDALWAGLPVLTCMGSTFAGRVAGSLLKAVGMPELITTSFADYEDTALAIAGDPRRLAALKAKLAHNLSTAPLFDTRQFARNIERAFEVMANRYRSGQQPESFAIDPEP